MGRRAVVVGWVQALLASRWAVVVSLVRAMLVSRRVAVVGSDGCRRCWRVSGGCGRLGAGDAGGSSLSPRALE